MFTLLQVILIWICAWLFLVIIGAALGSKYKESDPLMFKLTTDDVHNMFLYGGLIALATAGCQYLNHIICWIIFIIFAIMQLISIPTFIANIIPGGNIPFAKRLTGIVEYVVTLILTLNILFTFIL